MNKIYQKPFPGKKNAGFTLIELLVVVLIIGILSAIALPQYQKAVGKARVARALPLLRALVQAKQLYFLANGSHTGDVDLLDVQMPYGSKEEQEGGSTIYRETPIGRVQLSTMSEGVFWDGPGLVIDTFSGYQQCYPSANQANGIGEKICASIGRLRGGGLSSSGTNIYIMSF